MNKLQRRQALLVMISAPAVAAGCNRNELSEATEDMPTVFLENTRVGLRGFQIVSMTVGQRIIFLPTPGVRVLGVALLVSGLVTLLVIEYLDVELKRRVVREELSDAERIAVESKLAVEFQTENGLSESVALGPNQYEQVDSAAGNGFNADASDADASDAGNSDAEISDAEISDNGANG